MDLAKDYSALCYSRRYSLCNQLHNGLAMGFEKLSNFVSTSY